ncbi:hypothetical protein ABT288_21820 [Streptomyces sp. NPDC001093]
MNGDEQLLRRRVYGQDQQTYATLIGGPLDGPLTRACRPRP